MTELIEATYLFTKIMKEVVHASTYRTEYQQEQEELTVTVDEVREIVGKALGGVYENN